MPELFVEQIVFIDSKVFPSIHPSLQLTRNLHIYKHQEHSPTRSDNWSDNPHTLPYQWITGAI